MEYYRQKNSSLLANIELDFTKTLLSLTTPTQTKVQSQNLDNNKVKETSNTKKLAAKATELIKITQTVCTKEGENNPESAGNTEENKIVLISKTENKNNSLQQN